MKSLATVLAALSFAAAGPLPTRPPTKTNLAPTTPPAGPVPRDDDIHAIQADDQDGICTSLKFIQPGFTFGPTRTVFTTTSTITEPVDCGNCTDVRPTFLPLGVPPVAIFNATTTAAEPSYTTEYACGKPPTPTAAGLEKRQGGPPATGTITPQQGVATPACTLQTQVEASIPDSTSTVYPGTSTSTSEIDCGGCVVEWSTGVINFFAPVIQTTTTTATTASTKTELACATG